MNQAIDDYEEERGSRRWLITFADLMSLLLCFFVLLLSVASLDEAKFVAVKGSMRGAFGEVGAVRTRAQAEPTPITKLATTQQDEQNLRAILMQEIASGLLRLETQERRIVIRISEQASFESGEAEVRASFLPTIEKLKVTLAHINGRITVAGHTDDVPINTAKYRSNWALSAARAVSVLHALLDDSALDAARFAVLGRASNEPIVANDSVSNRRLNRRVDITIEQDSASPARDGLSTAGDM